MERYNWEQIPQEKVDELTTRQAIHTSQMTIARLAFKKGAQGPLHHHTNEQVTMLESGMMRFELAGQELILHPGDVLRIPPDVPHLAEALEDSVLTDLFMPPRTDWIKTQ